MILLRVLQGIVLLIASQLFACLFIVARLWRPGASRTVKLLCLLFVAIGADALFLGATVLLQIYKAYHVNLSARQVHPLLWCRIGSLLAESCCVWLLTVHLTGKSER